MIAKLYRQSGFAIFEVLVIFVVVGVIAALGYTFYGQMNKETASNDQSRIASEVQTAPEINQTSDLDKAEDIVDGTDLAASERDLAELEDMMSEF